MRTAAPASRTLQLQSREEEFATLFRAEFGRLTMLAGLMGADDPENVAQEAFARVHSRLNKFEDAHHMRGYLRTVVCNLARKRVRGLAVARRALPSLAGQQSAESSLDLVLRSDQAERVLSAVRELAPRQREVLVLRYWLGLSESEIAMTLGISAGSVKTHAFRAMKALENTLGDCE